MPYVTCRLAVSCPCLLKASTFATKDATVRLAKANATAMNEDMMNVASTSLDSTDDVRKHKMLLDLDGLGSRARFLTLLESGNAVLKSTVYQEFFSEWICL